MKVNELMIGDWVLFAGSKYQIHKEDYSANYVFEPIQLTSEILEKNGFKERDPFYGNKEYTSDFHVMLRSWDNGESFNFHFYESTSGRDCWFPYSVQYVHELQHYFKDCKIEKEIIL